MRACEYLNSALAEPLSYEVESKSLNPERVQEAQARVKQWRDQEALYLPNSPPDKITELKGSLDHPVAGLQCTGDDEAKKACWKEIGCR